MSCTPLGLESKQIGHSAGDVDLAQEASGDAEEMQREFGTVQDQVLQAPGLNTVGLGRKEQPSISDAHLPPP